jgi:translation initiation factor 2B subunit (eIF-2B alpha/beta/delta family)
MTPLQQLFDEITDDHRSGSGSLARRLMQGLMEITIHNHTLSTPEIKQIESMLMEFEQKMHTFALIRHFCLDLLQQIQHDPIRTFRDLYQFVLRYQQAQATREEQLVRFFLDRFPLSGKTVLTHSQSSTVKEILLANKDKKKTNVIQTESRPVMEGRQQAGDLAAEGYTVKLICDTAYAPLLKETDMVLVGADTIYSDLFINKCGTWALALLARKKNIPVYIVADSRKVIPEPAPRECIETDNMPPEEIMEFPPQGVQPVNHYFEAIPTRIITAVVTEKRIIPGQEVPLTPMDRKQKPE